MRFGDFLRVAVLLSAGCATLLAAQTVIQISQDPEPVVVYVSAAWWVISALTGLWLGRRAEATAPIARLLASARSQSTLPELRPGLTVINRLWLLLTSTLVAFAAAFWLPQVAAVAAGFAMMWALAWRHQPAAVAGIEDRDGTRFYVQRTSPFRAIELVRTPGFRGGLVSGDGRARG